MAGRKKAFFYPGAPQFSPFPPVGLIQGGSYTGPTPNNLFGVKISGPQYAPWLNQAYPSATDLSYLRLKGVGYITLPFAWEDAQPTLGAALDAAWVAKVKNVIALAKARGMSVILELCNFGAYITQAKWLASDGVVAGYAGNAGNAATGVSFLGDGTLTQAVFADFCTRFATAFVGTSGLKGYGLMNEPSPNIVHTNLASPANYFGVSSGLNSNFITNGAVVTQQAAGTNPLGANYSPAWSVTSGTGFGETFVGGITLAAIPYATSCYASCAAGTEAIVVKLDSAGTALTATTTWKRFVDFRTPAAGANKAASVQANSAAGHTISVANMQVEANPATSTLSTIAGSLLTVGGTVAGAFAVGKEVVVSNVVVATIVSLGTGTGGVGTYNLDTSPGNVSAVVINAVLPYAPNPFLPYAQAAIAAIAAVDPVTPIYVQGIFSSKAAAWPQYNHELGTLLTGANPKISDLHQYFDGPQGVGGGGTYSGSYASYGINANTGVDALAPALAWALATGKTIHLGEFGVTGLADAASWRAVQGNFLAALRTANVQGAIWNGGAENSQPDATFDVTAVVDDPRLLQLMLA